MVTAAPFSTLSVTDTGFTVSAERYGRDHHFCGLQEAYLFAYIHDVSIVHEGIRQLAWVAPFDAERFVSCENQSEALMVAKQIKVTISINCIDKALLKVSTGYALLLAFIDWYDNKNFF